MKIKAPRHPDFIHGSRCQPEEWIVLPGAALTREEGGGFYGGRDKQDTAFSAFPFFMAR